MKHYIGVLKKYAVFSGRAARPEYWYFVLFNIIISVVLSMLDNLFGTVTASGGGILSGIYMLAVLLPAIAVGVRRMHDIGKSGWWLLVAFVPVVGWIWVIVLLAKAGEAGSNSYGAPMGGGAAPAQPAQKA